LERTVSGFRSTSIEELGKWFDQGWIKKDIFKELLEDNGLLEEFISLQGEPNNNATTQKRRPFRQGL